MEQLDPEMLKMIDVLLDMDVLESESDWEVIEEIQTVEEQPPEEGGES